MRLSAIILTAVGLCSNLVAADVHDITVPAVIRAGESFVVNLTTPIQQPRYQSITWGLGPASAMPGQVGGYDHIGVTKLTGPDSDLKGQLNSYQIVNGLLAPYDREGQYALQAVLVGYIGAAGNSIFQTYYWHVNITKTGTTSNDVHVTAIAENSRSTMWP
ncbi:hypothetical protein QBC47DRAFT_439799 [Echria macrotheca]|uniref:Uncharacterized protein n=1 Tax=Echria macrotheca TaxID=438768 RepID=A0AAJ0F613_9PEZI|nr:hypothetical protein QBC47DRAFT_439799 [Echria macrotheca]